MSPCKKGWYRFSEIKNLDASPKKISAINSGMIIPLRVFNSVKYRDNLFLDMVDHAFCDDVRDAGYSFYIMHDVVLMQNYSRETDNLDQSHRRFMISKKDNRTYYGSSLSSRVFCEIQIIYWKIKKAIKYRSISILAW